ncbi:aldehyde dehydrogenase family protein [Ancylobacter amanitiformis]|uniref:Aldehyde dehydrogenase (NAD+) n=1 Tax=Ancylobacter amanitiformis TaxID=217069 RepID=A0ABU0LSW0_9HYPH|nr:aldehyde dehydrogenase family protein [Ancylobacter amanitiformis]MDQ0511764.1 aldehyde dehydrogenase (NAD+) [Ancylobacter amanitiformis]
MSHDFDPNGVAAITDHLIGGRRVAGDGAAIALVRPSDGAPIGTIRAGDAALVDEAVRLAATTRTASGWAGATPTERARVLKAWADLIDARRLDLARLEAATTTRPIADVVTRDLVRAAGAVRYFAEWADKIEGTLIAGANSGTTFLKPEPYGVIASIAPFNFPAINAIWKSAPALVTGNAVVLKPSELTPSSAVMIAELAIEAGLPAGLFNVVQGAGETGSVLVRHPLIGKITFTGSSATGARVMADAAMTGTKPLTLELGGKTPQLVMDDAHDLDALAATIAGGFLANAGQVCTAGTRLIAPRRIFDDLTERVVALAQARVPGPTWDSRATLPPIISEKQAARIDRMVEQTVADGARVLTGGSRYAGLNRGAYFEPTVLAGVPDSSVGFREEFFGPVLSVHAYDDEDEAIAMANHPSYALAASVYTTSAAKAMALPSRLIAGTVWVNGHGRQPDFATPQGGFAGSGFGKEMGRAGLEGFLRFKTVWLNHG